MKTTTKSWKDTVLKISNVASMLCVLDSTILPLVMFLQPLITEILAGREGLSSSSSSLPSPMEICLDEFIKSESDMHYMHYVLEGLARNSWDIPTVLDSNLIVACLGDVSNPSIGVIP